MFKEYGVDTQKGKVIRSMIKMGANNFYQDFEIENFKWIFNTNNVWARLSQLLKDWVVEVEYFDNTREWKYIWYKRAKYRLKDEAKAFYKKLYLENEAQGIFKRLFNL